MIVAIHQPNYLPYLGFFHKLAQADHFILLDSVDFVDDLFQQRNKIKTPQGWAWLSVPVQHVGHKPLIRDVLIAESARSTWGRKHWRTLQMNYSRSPHFKTYAPALEELFCGREWTRLVDVSEALIRLIAQWLRIETPLQRSSELPGEGHRTELLVSLCRATGATVYLSGGTGAHYLETAQFPAAGIELRYQSFKHPVYPQSFGEFIPNLCALDFLFQCGPESHHLLLEADSLQTASPTPA